MKNKGSTWREYLILVVIVLVGFFLRAYNLDFPSIGYHNMKENEYLSMSQEMIRTGDYITRRIYFYNAFENNPTMRLYPQPPLVSYQTIAAWKVFGENLWSARLINVFFGTASIVVMYALGMLLFSSSICALFCAFLLSIMPLAVFFSRNLQPESPAFFFMLLGNYWYMRFALRNSFVSLFLGGLAFSCAWMYKFSFLFGIVPAVVYFPYRTIFSNVRRFFKTLIWGALPYAVIIAVILWLKSIGQWEFDAQETTNRISPFAIFTPAYWVKNGKMIWWYAFGENFTLVYIITTLIGIIGSFIGFKKFASRFVVGWILTLVMYCMIFPDHINQHNYYQMPFLVLVCVGTTIAVLIISDLFTRIFKKNTAVVVIVLLVAPTMFLVYGAITRMHAAIFLGEDVAGETLRELTKPEDRIFLLTYPQGYGVARYARRYVGWPKTLDEMIKYENEFNVKYICFYPGEFALDLRKTNPDMFEYMLKNYHVKEVGLSEEQNKIFYVILEKGKGSNPETFLKNFTGSMQVRTIYKIFGRFYFFYSLKPPLE